MEIQCIVNVIKLLIPRYVTIHGLRGPKNILHSRPKIDRRATGQDYYFKMQMSTFKRITVAFGRCKRVLATYQVFATI